VLCLKEVEEDDEAKKEMKLLRCLMILSNLKKK